MALHLEDRDQPAADVDDPGILARPANDPGGFGRQLLQMDLGRLVGAMLRPHHREDAELDQVRRTPDQLDDLLVLVPVQPVRLDRFRRRHPRPTVRNRESKIGPAPGMSGTCVDVTFRMRHQPQYVTGSIGDSGDVARRAVRILDVAEHHPPLAFQPIQHLGSRSVVAVAVRSAYQDPIVFFQPMRERSSRPRDLQGARPADEPQTYVAHQGTRQHSCFAQDLKAVAHAQDITAGARECSDGRHDRRAGSDRTAAQVVAIGEAAGNADHVAGRQLGIVVPNQSDIAEADGTESPDEVAVAVGAGEGHDRSPHASISMR